MGNKVAPQVLDTSGNCPAGLEPPAGVRHEVRRGGGGIKFEILNKKKCKRIVPKFPKRITPKNNLIFKSF